MRSSPEIDERGLFSIRGDKVYDVGVRTGTIPFSPSIGLLGGVTGSGRGNGPGGTATRIIPITMIYTKSLVQH